MQESFGAMSSFQEYLQFLEHTLQKSGVDTAPTYVISRIQTHKDDLEDFDKELRKLLKTPNESKRGKVKRWSSNATDIVFEPDYFEQKSQWLRDLQDDIRQNLELCHM
jgi:hypothetical protein